MSGHSKWANIKREKAVVDAKKGAAYARLSREIIVAARGGSDANTNFKLRQAVDRARAEGMPNDNITRAIEKGSGGGAGNNLEELVYEGYGPGGVAVLVRTATDNRNRTAGDIRFMFSKHGGNMGESGCVNWLFKERGEIILESDMAIDEEMLLAMALESGADDIENSEQNSDGAYISTFVCGSQMIESVKEKLAQALPVKEAARKSAQKLSHKSAAKGIRIKSALVNLVPTTSIEVTDKESAKQLLKLLDALENQDDVQQIYANFDMQAAWLEEFASNG